MLSLEKINYKDLNARQKEIFNFQKLSGVLAEYGYTTLKLTDDWNGADFVAVHCKTKNVLWVQLKGRMTFAKKYLNKNLHIAFRDQEAWYLAPHDSLLAEVSSIKDFQKNISWEEGVYSFPKVANKYKNILSQYKIT